MLVFPPFQLDLADERLLKGGTELKVRRKPFAILKYLALHAKRLVTHEEVTEAVWGKIAISENALRTHIYELRGVVGDGVIETVIGRGYRFIADVQAVEPSQQEEPAQGTAPVQAPPSALVGREDELRALDTNLTNALLRKRQFVFLTGEPGIGKTALTDALLEHATTAGALVARGACVEQYGIGEAYLPVLTALGAACRGPRSGNVIDVLGRHAPTWLMQLPGVVPDDRLAAIQLRVQGVTQARMLRELADALEILSGDVPIVLALDDLQWADNSTTELLALLARRRDPARLLIIGTCRKTDAASSDALTRLLGELAGHRQATTISLGHLTASAVSDYVAARWPGHGFSQLGDAIHSASNGNPLFMVALLEDLESRKMVRLVGGKWELSASVDDMRAWRPDSVLQLIDVQIDRLPAADQRILEAAGAAGADFAAGVVAFALQVPVDDVDVSCEALAEQGRFVRYVGTEAWPDGTLQTRYAFVHALYQHAANARNPTAVIRAWRRRIGARLESAYGDGAATIAAELAAHFDAGQSFAEAARYYELAGMRANGRTGGVEAVVQFSRARDLLLRLPETPDRDWRELSVLRRLGRATIAHNALQNPQLIPTLTRAADLARRLGDDKSLAAALIGLQQCRMMRGDMHAVDSHSGEVDEVTKRIDDPGVANWTVVMSATAALFRGRLAAAHVALTEGARRIHEATASSRQPEGASFPYAPLMLSNLALAEWLLGRPDSALATARESVALAEFLDDPFTLTLALAAASAVHMWRGETSAALQLARRGVQIATDSGSGLGLVRSMCLSQSASVQLGETSADVALRELDRVLALHSSPGRSGRTNYVLSIADVAARAGELERALSEISDALAYAQQCDERAWEPELHRVRGELLKSTDRSAAERSFLTAVEVARSQSSRSFELRAAMSLHRLVSGKKKKESLAAVRRLYESFSEGRTTADLLGARRMLDRAADSA